MYEYPFGTEQQLNLNWIISEIISIHKALDPDYEAPTFDNAFPFMNLNALNLDWIIRELKTIKDLAPSEDANLLKMVANALISETYDATKQYNIDDIVYRDADNRLYICTTATPVGGEPWTASHWQEMKVGEALTDLLNSIVAPPTPYDSNPAMDGTASAGTSTEYARGDHVHPKDTARVPTSRTVNGKALSSNITLNASDIPNDSTVTGENVDNALDNLNYAIIPLEAIYQKPAWVIGSLSTNDGTEESATNQIRSNFIRCDAGTRISCASGYQFIVLRYDIDTFAYIGSSGTWQSTEYVLTGSNWIRIIVRKVDQSSITNASTLAEYLYLADYEIHNNVFFGSDSNGNYIKFGDGTLIQYGTKLPQVSMTTLWGTALYFGNAPDFVFPLEFVSTPCVSITVGNGQSALLMGCKAEQTGISEIQFCRATSATGAVIYHWVAIGRWK